jgi:hypothetical protein
MSSNTHTSVSVTAHDVVIDKLAITFDVPDFQLQLIAKRLKQVAQEKFGSPCGSPNYRVGARIWLNEFLVEEKATSSCVAVHALPKHDYYNACRVEWNPSKVSAEDVAYIVFGDILDTDIASVYDGTVTRIDLAVDVDNVLIDDFRFYAPKFQLYENRFKSGLTRYIGGRSGNKYYCCYDKRAQIIEHNTKVHPYHQSEVPDHPRMRVEAVIRPKLWWPECREMANPFTTLQLRRFRRPVTGDEEWDTELTMLLRLARYEGLNAALAIYKGSKKQRMLKKVLQSQIACDWWEPSILWQGYEKQFLEIDNFINPSINNLSVAVNCN